MVQNQFADRTGGVKNLPRVQGAPKKKERCGKGGGIGGGEWKSEGFIPLLWSGPSEAEVSVTAEKGQRTNLFWPGGGGEGPVNSKKNDDRGGGAICESLKESILHPTPLEKS